jgi:hypothetical protein
MGGVPIAAVAKYVGHSTIQMMMRYSHLRHGASQIAASVMDAFYESSPRTESETDTRTDTVAPGDFHSVVSD